MGRIVECSLLRKPQAAGKVRRMGACTFCRKRKIRCEPDPKDPTRGCKHCQSVSNFSCDLVSRDDDKESDGDLHKTAPGDDASVESDDEPIMANRGGHVNIDTFNSRSKPKSRDITPSTAADHPSPRLGVELSDRQTKDPGDESPSLRLRTLRACKNCYRRKAKVCLCSDLCVCAVPG